jgi:5-methyltetrahydropteroyltriglutamate--homocysteine methyltransferase
LTRTLDQVSGQKAIHFCYGNYEGQAIQSGEWQVLIDFLNG